jgi:two-component sensor histidine kinase
VEILHLGDLDTLNERQGFALALILNELITNGFRHGFPDGRRGTLTIRMALLDGNFSVEVADNGVGIAATPRAGVVGSGRSIVEALVRDELGGTVSTASSEQGTSVLISFPRHR